MEEAGRRPHAHGAIDRAETGFPSAGRWSRTGAESDGLRSPARTPSPQDFFGSQAQRSHDCGSRTHVSSSMRRACCVYTYIYGHRVAECGVRSAGVIDVCRCFRADEEETVHPSRPSVHPSIRPSVHPPPLPMSAFSFYVSHCARGAGLQQQRITDERSGASWVGRDRTHASIDYLSMSIHTYIHTYIDIRPVFPFVPSSETRKQQSVGCGIYIAIRNRDWFPWCPAERVCVCGVPRVRERIEDDKPPPAFSKGGHLFSSAYLCTNRPVFVRPSRSSDVYIYALVRVCSIVPANPGRTWVHIQDVYTYMYVGFDLFFLFLFSFFFFLFRFRHHGRTQSFLSFVPQHTRTSM